MSKKLVYVSGVYQGKEDNKINMECAVRYFRKYEGCSDKEYISAITAFEFLYSETEYLDGLDCCLTLLDKCDKIYMLPGWQESTGACIEFGYAKATGKEIYFADGLYDTKEFKEIKEKVIRPLLAVNEESCKFIDRVEDCYIYENKVVIESECGKEIYYLKDKPIKTDEGYVCETNGEDFIEVTNDRVEFHNKPTIWTVEDIVKNTERGI